MKIHLILFVSSVAQECEINAHASLMKTFDSTIRPMQGDIIDDPGFDSDYHNGYEVVKITMNYASEECWVSLSPLAIELENIQIETYIAKLKANGWQPFSKDNE
ncbi:hypothetical protein FHS16_003689 [Paenibacillus endophyticus]|uniref:Uncharacterized protein n=1 Tax=Paenibacillus endophyticus TaxID=1294268 RepID=A0A7W5CAK1_9BACL|nr:hypothetical protein [Paenibacillus endophyticus]MBB3153614.1 hypothetical protein [Paenibacillus endophyticus]